MKSLIVLPSFLVLMGVWALFRLPRAVTTQRTFTARITSISSFERSGCNDNIPFVNLQEEYARVVSLSLCNNSTDCAANCVIDCDKCSAKKTCVRAAPSVTCIVTANSTDITTDAPLLQMSIEGWENNDVVSNCDFGRFDRCRSKKDCELLMPLNLTAPNVPTPFTCGNKNHAIVGEFTWTVPVGWTCDPVNYDANDGCHCQCGIRDPDCDRPSPVFNCEDSGAAPPFICVGTTCVGRSASPSRVPSPSRALTPSISSPSPSRPASTSASRLPSPSVSASPVIAGAAVINNSTSNNNSKESDTALRAGVTSAAAFGVVALGAAVLLAVRWRRAHRTRVLAEAMMDDASSQYSGGSPTVTVMMPRDPPNIRKMPAGFGKDPKLMKV